MNFPIHLDLPGQSDKAGIQQASSFKQSVESALGKGNSSWSPAMSEDDFNNTGYFITRLLKRLWSFNQWLDSTIIKILLRI